MATTLQFRILNVFTLEGDPFSGNPLCVFEDGRGLSDATMQSLARQFNLSETTFILPATAAGATARVRIFTPGFEMPFAGHPTLGTSHVVRDLRACGDRVTLEMKAGLVPVQAEGNTWTLRAAYAPRTHAPGATRAQLAAMVGLPESAIAGEPLWVDTGATQLVIPLATAADVERATGDATLLGRHGAATGREEPMAYVWAPAGDGQVVARFLFLVHGGVVEDPATGSACANLGGWMIATGAPLPVRLQVHQGQAINRPSLLGLHVDEERRVHVRGSVLELGRGTLTV
jgi:PhzF family phenazine biosynthesis protein